MPKVKRRTAPELIGFHLGWDMREVSDGRYQNYTSPNVYVCGERYYCAPTTGQKPHESVAEHGWQLVGMYYGRNVYRSKLAESE
jgi:hypothetical protein